MIGKNPKTKNNKLIFTKSDGLKEEKVNKFGWFDVIFVVVSLALLIYRITISADNYDEIININVGYRFAVGQLPFWECRETFQTEGFILAPFLWLFMAVTKSTDGIVLFTRILYLLAMALVGSVVYNVFKNILPRKQAFYLGYMCLFFQVHCLYYLWYDSIAYITLSLSALLIYYTVTYEKSIWCMYAAGISAALMTLAYPSMVLVVFAMFAVLVIMQIVKRDVGIYKIVMFVLGGLTLAALVVLYIFAKTGMENFWNGLHGILGVRTTNLGGETANFIVKILKLIYHILNSFMTVNYFTIIPTFVVVLLFVFAVLKADEKQNIYLLTAFVLIFVTAVINIFFTASVKETYVVLNNFLGYIALWAPLIWRLINEKTEEYTNMIMYIWLPSILSSISVALTSVYAPIGGPVKCWEAFLPAALVTIVMLLTVLRQISVEENFKIVYVIKKYFAKTLLPMCCAVMLLIFGTNIYGNRDYPKITDKYNTYGIWAGIKTADYMKELVSLEKIVDENLAYMPSVKTIAASGYLRPIYLMSELTPLSPSVETINWNFAPGYWDDMENIPDIIYIQPEDYKTANEFFDKHYIRYNVYDIKYTYVLVMVKKDIYVETFC